MDTVPVWVFLMPVVAWAMGTVLIIFRKRLQRDAVAVEKKIGLPKWMRLAFMSENGGATLIIGIGFIVIGVLQAIIIATDI